MLVSDFRSSKFGDLSSTAESLFILNLDSTSAAAPKVIDMKMPRTPIPTIIRNAAIIFPSIVTGYISPHPTVVTVTMAHHNASPRLAILESGCGVIQL